MVSQFSYTFILTARWRSDSSSGRDISLQRTSQTLWFLVSHRWGHGGEWLPLVRPRQSQSASQSEISENWPGGTTWRGSGTPQVSINLILTSRWGRTNYWSLEERTSSGPTLPGWQLLSRVGPWSSYTARSIINQSRTPAPSPATPTPSMSSRRRDLTTQARTGSSLPRSLCRDCTLAPEIRIMLKMLNNKTIFA